CAHGGLARREFGRQPPACSAAEMDRSMTSNADAENVRPHLRSRSLCASTVARCRASRIFQPTKIGRRLALRATQWSIGFAPTSLFAENFLTRCSAPGRDLVLITLDSQTLVNNSGDITNLTRVSLMNKQIYGQRNVYSLDLPPCRLDL